MTPAAPTFTDQLLARFTEWEHHFRRSALPRDGYVVVRGASGDEVRSDTDGHLVRALHGRIADIAVRDETIALLVTDPDESARVELVSAAGRVVTVDGPPLRHEQFSWADQDTLVLTARSRTVVGAVDASSGRWCPLGVASTGRISVTDAGILLRDSDGGRALAGFDGRRLRALPDDTVTVLAGTHCPPDTHVVVRRDGIEFSFPDGTPAAPRWAAGATVCDAAADGAGVVVLTMTGGRHRLTRIGYDGTEHDSWVGMSGHDICSVTQLSTSGGQVHALVEGHATPPVAAAFPLPDILPGTRTDLSTSILAAPTDDGAHIDVLVTSPVGEHRARPVLLEAYGGFGVPFLPRFEPTTAAWLSCGGIVATAQIRGGGEHGPHWHRQGSGYDKIRAVEDLAAAARALVDAGLTTPDLIVLAGGSLGGTVAAACALRHPENVAGVVVTAAPLDLSRLHENPLGHLWVAEFGDARADPDAVARHDPTALALRYTPRSPGPAFLVIEMGHDTRVARGQGRRFTDILRRRGAPAHHAVVESGGHGANDAAALHDLGTTVLRFAGSLVHDESGDPR